MEIPFDARFRRSKTKIIDDGFPSSARTALVYVLVDLQTKGYLVQKGDVITELNRLGRFTSADLTSGESNAFIDQISLRIDKLEWSQVYSFCERVYEKLLRSLEVDFNDYYVSLEDVKQYFSNEVNLIIHEENLGYIFQNGQFQRRGRANTQKAFERVGAVLVDPKLDLVKNHYNKARSFFNVRPNPDLENCIKESLCALEACIEILTDKNASKEFEKVIKQLQGNDSNKIPPPIGESLIKLHSYRGSGQGVAHAAIQGNRVTANEAELVLSLVASYITYLVDLFTPIDEIPF